MQTFYHATQLIIFSKQHLLPSVCGREAVPATPPHLGRRQGPGEEAVPDPGHQGCRALHQRPGHQAHSPGHTGAGT